MSRGLPSMTALLGLLAIAGYQNRDKISEMLGGLGQGGASPAPGHGAGTSSLPGQADPQGGGLGGGLGGLLGGLGGAGGAERVVLVDCSAVSVERAQADS